MMRRIRPDLILGIGAYDDVSEIIFRRLSAVPDHPPLVAWIGDMFSASRADIASRFDLVAYTDTGFLDLHDRLGFRSRRAYIPLAASRATLRHHLGVAQRVPRLAFVAAETRNRREILNRLPEAVDLYGPGWGEGADLSPHNRTSRLVDGEALARIYAMHVAALNIRNGNNVINGMNQRHFAPYLQGAPVVSDCQRDIAASFDVGEEMLLYSDVAQLADICRDVRRHPNWAAAIGGAGRRRVLAHHTYSDRLAAIARILGLPAGSGVIA
jgi:hypothetical protein